MKIVFKSWEFESKSNRKETPALKNDTLINILISSLQTIDKDLDKHLNKDNENDENIKPRT